mmetsp:Transcript_14063/g.31902  ORF Transcript_14063/g.31902 Transcript_14063/m.31902 type:complete len:367 (-) Transcript_14063:52-1152(-)
MVRTCPQYSLVPGPTSVSPAVLKAFVENYGSSDLEEEFWGEYMGLQKSLQDILQTSNDIAIMSGEGMVALWGAMKSVIQTGDTVLSVVNGLYGDGFAEMAQGLGANMERVEFPWDQAVDNDRVIQAIQRVRPKLVTMVHCETPTGCLNTLSGIGAATKECGGLFLVDFVSSAGGAPLNVDEECIDLGLLASQKVIGAPPALAFVTISDRAWQRIQQVKYNGYDALSPFQNMGSGKLLPYTHNWHAIAATRVACQEILVEGLDEIHLRHGHVRDACIQAGSSMGLKPYHVACPSPTVTAFYVPDGIKWDAFNAALRSKGVVVAGSYGDLDGRIFRIGHMGRQADIETVRDAMAIIEHTIGELTVQDC